MTPDAALDEGRPLTDEDEERRREEAETESTVPFRRTLGFSLKLVAKHPLLLTAAVVAAVGVASADLLSLALVFPFIMSLGGEAAFPDGFAFDFLGGMFEGMTIEARIRTIALMLVGIQLVRGGLSYAESRISGYLAILFERDLRQLVFDDLLRVELRYIHKEKTATLFTLIHSFPKESARLVRDYLGGLSKAITGLMLVASLFALSWQLTLVALGLGGVSLFVVTRIRSTIKRLGREMNESRVRLHQASLESLQSMRVIRFFAREDFARKRFMGEVMTLQRQSYRNASLSAVAAPLQRILNMTLFAGLIIAGTFLLRTPGTSWLVLLTLFLVVVMRLMGPLSNFAARSARIAAETPALESVIEFLDREKPYLQEGDREFERLREGVRLEGVTFAHEAGGEPVLQDVSFEIRRGQMVALVGESGSGKSTLVQLLSRLADPTSGRILVDGADLRSYRSASWRRRVAVVSQDTMLFNASIRENIRFGRLEASDAEIEEAARLANAHEFIAAMAEGYDTRVGERGIRLSGGQAQRIAIARAILADPDVLVLDEATSALDTVTERAVQDAIDSLARERTVVAIAHRLSTIRHADLIVVMDKGRIVERGTHAELMALGGRYAQLVRLQDLGADAAPRAARAVTVPVLGPARPMGVVLVAEGRRALVRFDDGSEREMPLRVGADPALPAGDLAVLRQGESVAAVRVAGETHESVALFVRGADGREARARVREARGSGEPRVRVA